MALKIDLALAEYREKYLNINDIKELIGNFQGVLEDAFEKGYQAAQQEINEAEKTPTNTTKEATETPWPCKFSDSLVCAAKSCSDTNCDIYEPA